MSPNWIEEFEGRLERETLIKAFRYWLNIRSDADLPTVDSLDPVEMVSFLPVVNLIDAVRRDAGALRFRHRLVGTELVERFHTEHTGAWFDDLYTPAHLVRVLPEYVAAVEERRPVFGDISLARDGSAILSYRRLLLPLAGAEGSVIRLMAVFDFNDILDPLSDKDPSLPLHKAGRGSNLGYSA